MANFRYKSLSLFFWGMFLLMLPLQSQPLPVTQSQKSIRWEKLTFQNGRAYYENTPYSGAAEAYYPLKRGPIQDHGRDLRKKAALSMGI